MSKVIVLDPGHGGSSIGSAANGLLEKEINLELALAMREKLAAFDCRVILTRANDSRVTLQERTLIANRNNADLFISLHSNGASSSSANGYEDYIYTSPIANTSAYRDITHEYIAAVWVNAGRANRGKKRANFYVLRETAMPAILLENGFLTNAADAQLLKDAGFKDELATAMAEGTADALGLSRRPGVPAADLYRVQAGAFSSRARAEEHISRLKAAGFDAFIINLDLICPR